MKAGVGMSQQRVNWIGGAQYHNLTLACAALHDAFGHGSVFLCGSALKRRDHRDVDVRVILPDVDFDRLFPGLYSEHSFRPDLHGLWSLMCASISEWLSNRTDLSIDFQIQRTTQANAEHPRDADHPRSGIGLFLSPEVRMPKYPGGG
jgi:hypothetical protein